MIILIAHLKYDYINLINYRASISKIYLLLYLLFPVGFELKIKREFIIFGFEISINENQKVSKYFVIF